MRTFHRYQGLRYDGLSLKGLQAMQDELLDYVAACALTDPALDELSRTALLTAAECSLGITDVSCFPNGDQEIRLPLIDERLSSEEVTFGDDVVEEAPTARTWWNTFAICLVSGLIWDWQRVTGLVLREDFAPAIRDGVPYSKLTSTSDRRTSLRWTRCAATSPRRAGTFLGTGRPCPFAGRTPTSAPWRPASWMRSAP